MLMSPQQFGTVRPEGDIKYKDVNADGKITDDDRVPCLLILEYLN